MHVKNGEEGRSSLEWNVMAVTWLFSDLEPNTLCISAPVWGQDGLFFKNILVPDEIGRRLPGLLIFQPRLRAALYRGPWTLTTKTYGLG